MLTLCEMYLHYKCREISSDLDKILKWASFFSGNKDMLYCVNRVKQSNSVIYRNVERSHNFGLLQRLTLALLTQNLLSALCCFMTRMG